jgi:hypothetical protein
VLQDGDERFLEYLEVEEEVPGKKETEGRTLSQSQLPSVFAWGDSKGTQEKVIPGGKFGKISLDMSS